MKNTTIHKAIMLGGVSSLFAGAVWAGDVNLPITGETDVQGSLYAGGKLLSDETASYGTVSVDITGGSVSAGSGENVYWRDGVYGGASEFGNENTSFSADRVVINMSGGDMNNIVAGSFATEKGSVSIGSSEISISGGLVRNSVLGGSILTYDNNGTIKGHAVSEIGSSSITVSGDAVIGETVSSAKQKSENNDVIFNSVYGGGYTAGSGTQILGSTSVAVSGGAVVNGVVVGGSHAGPTGSAYVGDKNAADFSSVVSSVSISENADIRGGYVFGGAYHSWGDGAKSSDIYGSTLVKVDGGRIFNSDENAGYVFGGGYSSDGNDASHGSISNVYGSANVEISGGSVTNVYGGAYVNEAFGYGSASGGVMGGTNISITGGEVANVYGGGLTERVTGTDGLSVSSFVKGGSKIVISGGASVGGDVYGGGNGADSSLEGGTTVVLKDGASVAGTIYGGGANGATVSGERTFVLGSSGGTHVAASPVKVSGFDKIKIFKSEAVLDGIVGTADANMQILRGYAGDSTSNIRLTNADYSGISGTFDVSSPVYGEGKPFATSLINFSDNSTFTVESSSFDGMSLSGAGAVIINGRVWSGISGSSTLNLKDVSFSGNTASNLKTADNAATGLQNGLVSASVVNIDNARFLNNVAESASGVEGEGTSLYSGLVGGGKISISNSEFSGNEARQVSSGASGHNIYGGIAYAGGGVSISVDSTRFLNNSARASEGVSGGLIYAISGGDVRISGSSFEGNSAYAEGYKARGGAVANYHGAMVIENVSFVGNSAESAVENMAQGGALYARNYNDGASTTLTDVSFTGNSVKNGMGGAVFVEGSGISINATGDILVSGNSASDASGGLSDARGGFLYLENYGGTRAASASFNVSDGASLTIGDGRAGYDSIASGDSTASISKSGGGILTVNSSMAAFTGSLSVGAGTMNANGTLGASAIDVAAGAALGLTISGDNALSNAGLVLSNSGTINLAAKSGLAAGEYSVSAAGITDYGATKTYGGSLSGNVFTVSEAQSMAIDVPGEAITVAENGRVHLAGASGDTKIAMAFNSGLATVSSVTTTTDALKEAIGSDFNRVEAYAFDIAMSDGDTVVLSFFINDSSLKLSDFTIYHKSEGGEWAEASDITGATYDGETLSFMASHFSEYGYSAIPEPAAVAAAFGALALLLAALRRKNRAS